MTDKATVEISSPVTGVVTFRVGEPGEVLAVGTEFVGIETRRIGDAGRDGRRSGASAPATDARTDDGRRADAPRRRIRSTSRELDRDDPPAPRTGRATDRRAGGAGAGRARSGSTSSSLAGSGPDGRVVHADLDRRLAGLGRLAGRLPPAPSSGTGGRHDETVMRAAPTDRRTPHRGVDRDPPHHLRRRGRRHRARGAARRAEPRRRTPSGARLTMLPFLVRAIVLACREQPAPQRPLRRRVADAVDVRRRARRHRHPDARRADGARRPSTPTGSASGTSPARSPGCQPRPATAARRATNSPGRRSRSRRSARWAA